MRRILLAAAALVAMCVIGATFALDSEPADALTPTPSFTPAPAVTYVATNTTGAPAIQLNGGYGLYAMNTVALLSVSPVAGCGTPVVTQNVIAGSTLSPTTFIYTVSYHILWPTPCVPNGASVTLGFSPRTPPDVLPLSAGHLFSSIATVPTPALTPTHTPSATPTATATLPPEVQPPEASMALDCDVFAPGIQAACSVPLDAGTTAIDTVLTNTGTSPFALGAFDFRVLNPDTTRLDGLSPAQVPCASPFLDCNPDFNQSQVTGTFLCGLPRPSDDFLSPGPEERSYMGCFSGYEDGNLIMPGESISLARSTYTVPLGATLGSVPLTLFNVFGFDDTFTPIFACGYLQPDDSIVDPCENNATITFIPAAGLPTATSTPVPGPPTATPTSAGSGSTPSTTPTTSYFFAIDCDARSPGYQSSCTYATSAGSIDIGVILFNNSGTPFMLGSFDVRLRNPDPQRLLPPAEPPGLDSNPDVTQSVLGNNYGCSLPIADDGSGGSGTTTSIISCNAEIPVSLVLGPSELVSVRYNIPSGALPGTVLLSAIAGTGFFDTSFGLLGTCTTTSQKAVPCLPATITLVAPPATATPTQVPPGVDKIPEGNPNNADLSVPKANLWLCEAPAACAGPGEGALRVVERASNVLDGLGAYEFTVEYDNFVIESINPCDLVFGPGGAGLARGPVDELDTSAVNPDCTPDPGAGGGTCAYSLVLENLVHFGCATSGQAAGPTGDFDLASLLLVPHPDLRNDLFPGNDNGVLTVLKDNGCELVDIVGHPVTGSVNGGLTPFCRDLAVTVRILEGDLDLDCDVDLTDAQSIASRYGAFFGGLLYSKWYDLEPALHDLDIDIKDVQKVFGRQGSTCQTPVPAQPPLDPPFAFGD